MLAPVLRTLLTFMVMRVGRGSQVLLRGEHVPEVVLDAVLLYLFLPVPEVVLDKVALTAFFFYNISVVRHHVTATAEEQRHAVPSVVAVQQSKRQTS